MLPQGWHPESCQMVTTQIQTEYNKRKAYHLAGNKELCTHHSHTVGVEKSILEHM
jgi:hypothetical protein